VARPLTIALLFTTFPKTSEAFLQRDVVALQARGVNLQLYSLWGGGGQFHGLPVRAQSHAWFFLSLLWWIPYEAAGHPRMLWELIVNTLGRRAPSKLNFWENMLGAGFTTCWVHEFRRNRPDLVHAVWAGAPATAAWLLWRVTGIPYSVGAHAYDIYEHGGDWWLLEKLQFARFVHTSTEMGRQALMARGAEPAKIELIRRGLETFPPCRALRVERRPLRLVCVARLVPKKGLDHQLRIYAALRAAGLSFEVRIVGDGPLREALEGEARVLGLESTVRFEGRIPHAEVWRRLEWADVLVHTGVVAASGDRDGLPNVIPEAMAAGVLVVTSPVAATTEAVQDGRTGLVADVNDPAAWVAVLRRLAEDDALAERLRRAARCWVEENYDAHRNMTRLIECCRQAVAEAAPPARPG
jgi:glycosyltransferase involved in cell wall biosynthesis